MRTDAESRRTRWPTDDDDAEPLVDEIRAMLTSMSDGDISVSAYDTAWVGLVPRLDGGEGPQFPAAVRWIRNNQLPDGSWGDAALFSAYDRLINTLACVVTLTRWSLEPEMRGRGTYVRTYCVLLAAGRSREHKTEVFSLSLLCSMLSFTITTGLSFLGRNMWKLATEDEESMPIGFELAFPSLIELAKSLGVHDFPYDHQALQAIYSSREIKMKRIPKEVMHTVPTSILHSLEGMPGLDWARLLKLQSSDGSFLFSPAATAYALMNTGDDRCFSYIDRTVKKFNGGGTQAVA